MVSYRREFCVKTCKSYAFSKDHEHPAAVLQLVTGLILCIKELVPPVNHYQSDERRCYPYIAVVVLDIGVREQLTNCGGLGYTGSNQYKYFLSIGCGWRGELSTLQGWGIIYNPIKSSALMVGGPCPSCSRTW